MGIHVGNTIFDTFMIWLPVWLPVAIVSCVIHWLIVRSATLSALRKHAHEQQEHHGATYKET